MRARLILLGVGLVIALAAAAIWPRVQAADDPFRVAMRLLAQGRGADAALLLEDSLWRGVAEYRAGRFSRAAEAFAAAEDETSLYNLGTALAQLERWDEARAAFEGALLLNPDDEDALHNLELVTAAGRLAEDLAKAQRKTFDTDSSGASDAVDKQGATATEDPDGGSRRSVGEAKASEDQSQTAGEASRPGRAAERAAAETATGATATLTVDDDGAKTQADGTGAALILRESTHEAEILLRRIKDDPARVLRARLRAAHKARQEGGTR